MTRNFLISYKHNLTIISFLALGLASILLLIPHHLNYAYSESYYFIKSKLNGMVLDIRGADPFAGAFVQTWPANGNNNQLWTITSDGFIKSKLNGMVLDIEEPIHLLVHLYRHGQQTEITINYGQLLVMGLLKVN